MKKISLILAMMMAFAVCFSGCAQNSEEKWGKTSTVEKIEYPGTNQLQEAAYRLALDETIKSTFEKLDNSAVSTYADVLNAYSTMKGKDTTKTETYGSFTVETKVLEYNLGNDLKSITVRKQCTTSYPISGVNVTVVVTIKDVYSLQ